MSPATVEDRLMLEQCIAGDEKALETFVRRFSSVISKTVRRTLEVKHVRFVQQDVQDLLQTVFLKLLDNQCAKLHQYKGINGCSLASWLRVATVRIVLSDIRDKANAIDGAYRRPAHIEDPALVQSEEPGTLELLIHAENQDQVRKGMKSLSARDRMFIRLHVENGLPLKDAAETMALSMGSAYTLKHRIISRLKSFVAGAEQKG